MPIVEEPSIQIPRPLLLEYTTGEAHVQERTEEATSDTAERLEIDNLLREGVRIVEVTEAGSSQESAKTLSEQSAGSEGEHEKEDEAQSSDHSTIKEGAIEVDMEVCKTEGIWQGITVDARFIHLLEVARLAQPSTLEAIRRRHPMFHRFGYEALGRVLEIFAMVSREEGTEELVQEARELIELLTDRVKIEWLNKRLDVAERLLGQTFLSKQIAELDARIAKDERMVKEIQTRLVAAKQERALVEETRAELGADKAILICYA